MPAFVKKPAKKQTMPSWPRSGGVWPKIATSTVDSTSTPIVRPFKPKRIVKTPSTAPPVAPPAMYHVSTPPAELAGKPISTTMFGTHFKM